MIPPARREMLDAMSDTQLAGELRAIRDSLAFHAPHVANSLRAKVATEALRQSELFVTAVQNERLS